MTAKERVSYGLGGFGKNVAFTLVSTYTLYYYNSVLEVSASFVGTLLMVARFFDAFNDPLMGVVVEKSNSKYGKYKPWILSGAVLNAFILFAMFSVPEGLTAGGMKTYIAVTYLLCGITYTLTDIPYWSIIPAITSAGPQRERMSIVARTFTGIGSGVGMVFTMYFVEQLGGGTDDASMRIGFSIFAAIVAVIYVVTTIITVKYMPKEKHEVSAEKKSVIGLFKNLLKNDQALVLSLIIILFYSATTLTMNTVIYIFDYDMVQPKLYTPFMACIGVIQFVAMTGLYVLLRKKHSNRDILLIACAIGMIGYVIFGGEIPMDHMNFVSVVIPGAFVAIANGLVYVLVTILVADAVDYGEKKTGVRENSMVSSLQTLMVKLSSAVAIFIAGIGVDYVGFVGKGEQAADVITRLHSLVAIPSMIMFALASLLVILRKDI